MSYRELFVSPSPVFSGIQRTFEEAEYVILGAPLDSTSTYRSGARFAPLAIREASLNIETHSFRTNMDVEDLKIHDLGDLHIAGKVDETLKRLELVTKDLLDAKKTPLVIGGEHTITLGVIRSLGENVTLVSLDAHLDLRNEYMGLTTSHATFMRRIKEQVKPHKILEIGTGSGYMTALLASQAGEVDSVDIFPDFIDAARVKLAAIEISNVNFFTGDGAQGWASDSQYDAILLTGSVASLPPAYPDLLAANGRLLAIVGTDPIMEAVLYKRDRDSAPTARSLFDTSIPPLVGAAEPPQFIF